MTKRGGARNERRGTQQSTRKDRHVELVFVFELAAGVVFEAIALSAGLFKAHTSMHAAAHLRYAHVEYGTNKPNHTPIPYLTEQGGRTVRTSNGLALAPSSSVRTKRNSCRTSELFRNFLKTCSHAAGTHARARGRTASPSALPNHHHGMRYSSKGREKERGGFKIKLCGDHEGKYFRGGVFSITKKEKKAFAKH